MSQELKQAIKRVNSSTAGDKGKKQQVKGVKEQFVGLLGEYQVSVHQLRYFTAQGRTERSQDKEVEAGIRSAKEGKERGARGRRSSSPSFAGEQLEQRKGGEVEAVLFVSLADVFLPSFSFLLRFCLYQNIEKTHRSKVKQRAERQFKIGSFLLFPFLRKSPRLSFLLEKVDANHLSFPLSPTTTVKPDATPQEIENVLESDNPQIFQQAVSFIESRAASASLTSLSLPSSS